MKHVSEPLLPELGESGRWDKERNFITDMREVGEKKKKKKSRKNEVSRRGVFSPCNTYCNDKK